MQTVLKTAPTVEPITTTEAKNHLRIDSGSFADDITSTQCIASGSHAVAAAYSLKGTAVDVSDGNVLVLVDAGDCSGGTVDLKLQESNTNVDGDFTDVSSGAFTQIGAANDNQVHEKAYTGSMTYLRVVGTVAGGACSFGVSIVVGSPAADDDDYIDGLIVAAREHVENYLNRKLITQTWYAYLNAFPSDNFITLPFGSLQSITSIKYTDTDESQSTFSTDDYAADTYSQLGRAVLDYGSTWPTTALWPNNPIVIEFVCGYGDARTDVPQAIRSAMKLVISDLYENRESKIVGTISTENKTVNRLLASYRLFKFGDDI